MILPEWRQEEYAIWRCCERFGIRPPGVMDKWEDCDVETRTMMIVYSQIREEEENERSSGLLGAGIFA